MRRRHRPWISCGWILHNRVRGTGAAAALHPFPRRIHMSHPTATLGREGPCPRFHRAHHYWMEEIEQPKP
jgi:hypothetical protein